MTLPEGSYSHTEFNDSEVEIGKYTGIAANCRFHGADNHITVIDRKKVSNNLESQGYSKGKIKIGNDVWIGEGVRLLSGVTVGDGVIVGAGSVISRDIPSYAITTGNPGIVRSYRFTPDIIEKLLGISLYNWDREKIMQVQRDGDFNDITIFLSKHYGT